MSRTLGGRDRHLLRRAQRVVGIDEVGRGPLAGPVVVAGVAWCHIPRRAEVQDSKSVASSTRIRTARWIRQSCDGWVAIEVWPEIIDEVNILRATRIAMEAVCRRLYRDKTIVVVDGVRLDWRYEALSESDGAGLGRLRLTLRDSVSLAPIRYQNGELVAWLQRNRNALSDHELVCKDKVRMLALLGIGRRADIDLRGLLL